VEKGNAVCRSALREGPCMANASSVTRCGTHSGGVGCKCWAGCGLECAIIERLTLPPHMSLPKRERLHHCDTQAVAVNGNRALRLRGWGDDCDDQTCKQSDGKKSRTMFAAR
jgi:hypothetical protein